jgi:outer membrane protein TolC
MKRFLMPSIFLLCLVEICTAQTLRLETCYEQAKAHHPMAEQKTILADATALSKSVLATNLLPKVQLNAQATLQSDVTSIPISLPNITIPTPHKDQYKATVDVNQVLYDGNATKSQVQVQDAQLAAQQQQVEVGIYSIRDKVNQLFFNALLADENLALTQLLKQDIQTRLDRVNAGLRNGVGAPVTALQLQAELAKIDARFVELRNGRKTALDMLAELMGAPIPENVSLERPSSFAPNVAADFSNRPETRLYALQKESLNAQMNALNTVNKPKLSAFLQAGLGRPGLNAFKTDFAPFAIGGLRLSWTLWDWGATKKQQNALDTQKRVIDTQSAAFEQSTRLQLIQAQNEADKLVALLDQDRAIIALRVKIKENVAAQLENGIATANDYLTEVNAENQAKQNMKLHELQLLLSKVNVQTALGK